jgi:hypothetical protein
VKVPAVLPRLGVAAVAATLACRPPTAPASRPPDAVLVGAGDIAVCSDLSGAQATARLLDAIPGTVFTLGDLAYPDGTAEEFANCYDPTWGRHKARTRSSIGNHDYHTPKAAGYFAYWGDRAGDPAKGYYSYEAGAWHVVVINSNCDEIGGCQAGSPQEQWLRADLGAHPTHCTLSYWHHPLFSSGVKPEHALHPEMRPIWQALYEAGAELVVNGHEHNYERFALQDPDGNPDPRRGVREIVAGLGGRSFDALPQAKPNSEVRNAQAFGVLKLTLHPDSYDWEFVPVAGQTFTDSGSGACH